MAVKTLEFSAKQDEEITIFVATLTVVMREVEVGSYARAIDDFRKA